MTETLPSYDQLPVRDGAPPQSSWGVWGDHDVFGTLNLLTPERVLAAARSIRTGRTFALNPELTLPDPPLFGRARVRHEITGELGGGHDDLYHDWNTQSSAQWDGFRHFAHRDHGHYGGVPDQEHGIHYWAERGIVGRAVLADVARWREQTGRPIEQGTSDPITADDLTVVPRRAGHHRRDRRHPPDAHRVDGVVPRARRRRARRLRERTDGAEPRPDRARRARAALGPAHRRDRRPTTRPSR